MSPNKDESRKVRTLGVLTCDLQRPAKQWWQGGSGQCESAPTRVYGDGHSGADSAPDKISLLYHTIPTLGHPGSRITGDHIKHTPRPIGRGVLRLLESYCAVVVAVAGRSNALSLFTIVLAMWRAS